MKEDKDKNSNNSKSNKKKDEVNMNTETNDKIKESENGKQTVAEELKESDNSATLNSAESDKTDTASIVDNNPKSKKKFRWVAIAICAAIFALGIAGGTLIHAILSDDNDHNKDNSSGGYTNDINSNDYIGEDEAKSIALEHAAVSENEVSNISCHLDRDDRIVDYDVEFWVGNMEYDYEIDAVTGEILSYDNDLENNGANYNNSSSQNSDYITSEEAKNIALKDAGLNESDTTQLRCEFDYDDGQAEYEVEWRIGNTEYEYTISAIDGSIWERDIDRD